jgi:hypothetical protein
MDKLLKKSARVMVLLLFLPTASKANLELISPEEYEKGKQRVEQCYSAQDITTLRGILSSSHLFVQARAALALGRLGDQQALDTLKKLDNLYRGFACAPTGEFGVAIILIENYSQGSEAQKKALLEKAVRADSSVSSAAARELARFDDLSIIDPLSKLNEYGAQYTVLRLKCNRLLLEDRVELCVQVLEEHKTPMTAQSAQEVLIESGAVVVAAVKNLSQRIEAGKGTSKPELRRTIMSRCEHILQNVQ